MEINLKSGKYELSEARYEQLILYMNLVMYNL